MKNIKFITLICCLLLTLLCVVTGVISASNPNVNIGGGASFDRTVWNLDLDLSDPGISSIKVEYPSNNPTVTNTYSTNTTVKIPVGTSVKLTANANSGEYYEFASWQSSEYTISTSGSTGIFTINKDGAVKALSNELQTTLNIDITDGVDSISVSTNNGTSYTTYTEDKTLTLRRGTQLLINNSIDSDYTFNNWLVDSTNKGTTKPYALTLTNATHTVSASATYKYYDITINKDANVKSFTVSNATLKSGSTYKILKNAKFTITPTFNTYYAFKSYTGDYSSTTVSNEFTATKNGSITINSQVLKSTITLNLDEGFTSVTFNGTTYTSATNTISNLNQGTSYNVSYVLKAQYDYNNTTSTLSSTTTTFTPISATHTISFKSTPKTYSITYKDQGDKTFSGAHATGYPTSHTYGTETALKSATKTGYDFGGWFTSSDCSGSAITSIAPTTYGAQTLYAKWTPKTYNITYLDQGGSAFSGTHASGYPTTHTYGSTTTLKTASKTGYDFGGWFIASACTGTAVTSLSAAGYTSDITLYAKWTIKTFTVTIKSNNDSYGTVSPASVTSVPHGTTVTVDGNKLTINKSTAVTVTATPASTTGHTNKFSSWDIANNAEITSDKTITATFTQTTNTYTITYAGNGSTSGSTASSSHTYNSAKQITANGFTRAYTVTFDKNTSDATLSTTSLTATYSFKGWYSNKTGGSFGSTSSVGTSIASTSTLIANSSYVKNVTSAANGSVTFTAQWTSASVTLPTPTRTGYTFNGWYTAASGGDKIGNAGESYTPTAGIKLYAQWSPKTDTAYTVKHYVMNTSGAYPSSPTQTDNLKGTSAASLTLANLKDSDLLVTNGIVYKEAKVNNAVATTASIAADGSLVVSLYYERKSYAVTLTKGSGISAVSGAGTYYYGANVSINATVSAGYTWSKWTQTSGGAEVSTTKAYSFTMPASALNYTATTTPNTNTKYYVQHYTKDLGKDTYTLTTTTEHTGTTGTTATATSTTITGFTYNANHASNVKTGAIAGDGSLTLKLYYSRNTYTITWKNGNTTLETDSSVEYGATPAYNGSTPTKAATAQYTYTFSGWSPAVATVSGDATYSAQFSSTVNKYKVTWKNGSTTLETDENVPYGTTPTYNGTTPTKAATAQYTYTFSGWSPAVAGITGNTTYTAQFSSTTRTYTLTLSKSDSGISGFSVTVDGESKSPYSGNSYSIEYGASVQVIANIASGYQFLKWSGGSTSSSESILFTMTGDISITAHSEVEYTVTYVHYVTNWITYCLAIYEKYTSSNGLTLPDLTDYANQVQLNGTLYMADALTFEGWYETEDFKYGSVSKINSGTTGNKTYYARWVTSESFDVSVYWSKQNSSGETVASMEYDTISMNYNEYYDFTSGALSEVVSEKTSNGLWTLEGFYKNGTGNKVDRLNNVAYTGENVIVAVFTPLITDITISVNSSVIGTNYKVVSSNGWSKQNDTSFYKEIYPGSTFGSLPVLESTDPYYTFKGWNISSTTIFDDDDEINYCAKTGTAQWTKNQKLIVHYVSYNDSSTLSTTQNYYLTKGSTITVADYATAISGYTYSGDYLLTGNMYIQNATTQTLNSDMEIQLLYNKNLVSYTLTVYHRVYSANTLLQTKTYDVQETSTVNKSSYIISISGYSYYSGGSGTLTMPSSATNFTIYYTKDTVYYTLTVKHVDSVYGSQLHSNTTHEIPENTRCYASNYTESISGYEYNSASVSSFTMTADRTITIYYEEEAQLCSYTINYYYNGELVDYYDGEDYSGTMIYYEDYLPSGYQLDQYSTYSSLNYDGQEFDVDVCPEAGQISYTVIMWDSASGEEMNRETYNCSEGRTWGDEGYDSMCYWDSGFLDEVDPDDTISDGDTIYYLI